MLKATATDERGIFVDALHQHRSGPALGTRHGVRLLVIEHGGEQHRRARPP